MGVLGLLGVYEFKLEGLSLGFRAQGLSLGFRAECLSLEFRVEGLSLGFRVWGSLIVANRAFIERQDRLPIKRKISKTMSFQ